MKKWYGTHRIQLRSPTGLPTWKSTPENIQNKAKNKRKSRKKGDREFYRQCEIKIGEGKCDHINLVKSFSPFVGHFFCNGSYPEDWTANEIVQSRGDPQAGAVGLWIEPFLRFVLRWQHHMLIIFGLNIKGWGGGNTKTTDNFLFVASCTTQFQPFRKKHLPNSALVNSSKLIDKTTGEEVK